MSFARFGWDNSDVYVFLNAGGYLDCCGCILAAPCDDHPEHTAGLTWKSPEEGGGIIGSLACSECGGLPGRTPRFYKTVFMLEHLMRHVEAGHTVPEDCMNRLVEEMFELDAEIAEMNEGKG